MPTIPELLLGKKEAERELLLRSLPTVLAVAANRAFAEWAHRGQVAPQGDWRTWVLMAGRGFGKTRGGGEWVLEMGRGVVSSPGRGGGAPRATEGSRPMALPSPGASGRESPPPSLRDNPPPRAGEDLRIALVAATVGEARAVMVEGPSGLLACARPGKSPSGGRRDAN
jgi:hypothetical protein